MKINLRRFEKSFSLAQFKFDSAVMLSLIRFMPMQTGTFIKVTQAMSAAIAGSGKVVAAAPPMGRMLYEGLNMVDELTGSPWARKGARKALVSKYRGQTLAKMELEFSTTKNADAQPHWFDPAKKADLPKWLKIAKTTAGGANR